MTNNGCVSIGIPLRVLVNYHPNCIFTTQL